MLEEQRDTPSAFAAGGDNGEHSHSGCPPIDSRAKEIARLEPQHIAADFYDVQFVQGTRFKLGGLIVGLAHCLTLDRVVVMELASGEMRVVTRAELTPIGPAIADGVDPPINLVGASEEALASANSRYEALRPYITSGVLTGRDAHQLARQLKVSVRTLRRWTQRYKERGDLTAFIDRAPGLRHGQRSLAREVEAIIQFAVTRKLASSGNCTVRSVYEAIRGDCQAIGQAAPAPSTVLARIKSLKANPAVLPTEVGRKIRERTRFVRGSAGATRALERVEIDHTLVDTHLVDRLDGQPIGRPWLTIAIDVATRAVLGFVLTLEHPSRLSVALCVQQAIFLCKRTVTKPGRSSSRPDPISRLRDRA
jgi:putative transposase